MSLVTALENAVIPKRSSRPYFRQHKYTKHSVDAYIDEGGRMESHMRSRFGIEATADFMQQPVGANCGKSMPYRFYLAYCDEILECKFTKAKREYLRRALKFYAQRKACGAITRCAMRGFRKLGSYRGNGGKNNPRKLSLIHI